MAKGNHGNITTVARFPRAIPSVKEKNENRSRRDLHVRISRASVELLWLAGISPKCQKPFLPIFSFMAVQLKII